jgi:3',5'-cyclic AMP phosphodiesterase CpdA
MRTIIFSDVHGEPSIIAAVVEHSNYRPDVDRLIFAGDAIEIGRDSLGCLELLDELGAECLVGNHDYAAFTGMPIEHERIPEDVLQRVGKTLMSGRWHLAAEADGVLITHGGVSELFLDAYEQAGSVAGLVETLNAGLAVAIESYLTTGDAEFDEAGPLWWRPGWGVEPLPGVVQVVGHSPLEMMRAQRDAEDWETRGIYLVDPYVRGWRMRRFKPPAPVRYAVIEDGNVRVVEG